MGPYLEDHLANWAAKTPDATAFRFGKEALSYDALNVASDRLARLLRSVGIGPGDHVGIYMDQCLPMAVAVYGILKSGAAYVPLDSAAPATRTANIIDVANVAVILTQPNKTKGCLEVSKKTDRLDYLIGAEVDGLACLPFDADADAPDALPLRSPEASLI